MNYLHRFLVFDTVEQGEKNLDEAIKIRDNIYKTPEVKTQRLIDK